MTRSNPPAEADFADSRNALLWGAWVELGVSGWQHTHSDWVIDPEPLIIATATLGEADPRLQDEALDWCVHNWRFVSRVRLRNLVARQSPELRERWGPFAGTVSKHAGVQWPSADEAFEYRPTGRSVFDSMAAPSRAWVRLRGMFGVGARAEIIRYFLTNPHRATVATISETIGYTKRNVGEECDVLARAGVLRPTQVKNRFYYALAHRSELEAFVGDIAQIRVDWSVLLDVVNRLVDLESAATGLSHRGLMVRAHRVALDLDDRFDQLGIEGWPSNVHGDAAWPAVRDFARGYVSAWADGKWEPDDPVRGLPRRPVKARPARRQVADSRS